MSGRSTFWMVWRECAPGDHGDRTPTHKHLTRDDAESEAARLSMKYPKSTLYVLRAESEFSPKITTTRIDLS